MGRSDADKQVVVITGASAGVGRAIAEAFAKRGARIGLIARGQDRLDDAKREVENLGGTALTIQADVAEYDQLEAAAQKIEEEFGAIDIWVNNAMTTIFSRFVDIKPEEFRRVTDVVYHGTVYGTMIALKSMLPRDSGTIVQIGSALAYRGIPLQSAYCGAKHATLGMFDSVRTELIHRQSNITLSMVQLPAINTPQFNWVRNNFDQKAKPVPPIFQPEVAADAVLHAVDTGKREVVLGASTMTAIYGNKLLPALGDWYLGRFGVDDQLRDEKEEQERADNLFEPAPGDYAAHGDFDDEAYSYSSQFWAAKNKWWLTAGAGMAGVIAGLLLKTKKS